jgi:uncharacterized C2H2 Zn-finger protein
MAHQCPRCELLFSYRTEVEAHLATDHRPSQERTLKTSTTPVDLKTVTPKAPAPS